VVRVVKVVVKKTFFLRVMPNFIYKLESYHGQKSRFTCPNCHRPHKFVRYVDESGNYLSDEVGRCNRESNCGYHFTPKEFFSENTNHSKIKPQGFCRKTQPDSLKTKGNEQIKADFIGLDVLQGTLTNYEKNGFVQFLLKLFPDDIEAVKNVIQKYAVGTWKDGKTVFWQIDQNGKIRTGKLIAYDVKMGKRKKDILPSWIHAELKKAKLLPESFQLQQCFFGEHILRKEPNKQIAIVEAEKTAIIASLYFPEMLWLAVGGKSQLTSERLNRLPRRKVFLFPDADAFTDWQEKAVRAQRNGLDVRISKLIETRGTENEKSIGFDLADYLIAEKMRINQLKLVP